MEEKPPRFVDRVKDSIREREIKKTIVSHWHENKRLYVVAVGCVITTYLLSNRKEVEQTVKQINIFSPHSSVIANLQDRTNYAQPVRCLTTGEVFGSQKRAALANGVDQGLISRHLGGELPHVKGLEFERI